MGFTQEIELARHRHITANGSSPTKLYLGRVEWEAMKDLAYEMTCYRMLPDFRGDRRAEYRGLKIYAVDDENYVAVGA